jgi:hypothetical protein
LADHMAPRDHRIWHDFWHSTRNSWHKFTKEQRAFFVRLDPRWEPARLLGAPPGAVASVKYNPLKNSAGEDFLYMHHQMMTELFQAFASAHLPCPEPWTEVPDKNDKTWAIEPSRDGSDEKSDAAYAQLEGWRKQFQSPNYLAGKSLGEVGYLLENSLHNNMHMRFGTYEPPKGFSDRPEISPETLAEGLERFDDPDYNWLWDSYSAHVNPTFWKLHGLVENVLYDWLKANGKTEVAEDCEGRASCYQWKGTWVGARPGHGPMRAGPTEGHKRAGGPGHQSDAGAGFTEEFQRAYDDFLDGGDAAEGADPSKSLDRPGGPRRAGSKDHSERERRRKVLSDAFHILQKNSGMNRGRLKGRRLEKIQKSGPVSAEEYVKWVDSEEK